MPRQAPIKLFPIHTMTARIAIVLVLITGGLSLIFALPEPPPPASSACILGWPNELDGWVKIRDKDPSPAEIAILKGAAFAKADYVSNPGTFQIDAGIVLSTTDVNETIHRPERCLPAQGHKILKATSTEVVLPNGVSLPLTRLHTRITRTTAASEEQATQTYSFDCVTYYWFVGKEILTANHYGRTLEDMRYRLLTGGTQRWAYVTVAAYLPAPEGGGENTLIADPSNPFDERIKNFIKQSAREIIDFDKIVR